MVLFYSIAIICSDDRAFVLIFFPFARVNLVCFIFGTVHFSYAKVCYK